MLNITKIQLALNAIGFMATRHNQINEGIPLQQSTQEMLAQQFGEEENLLNDLIMMSENFANYMNSRDMTNSVDEAILNPIFDVLHGRIDEDDEEIKTNL